MEKKRFNVGMTNLDAKKAKELLSRFAYPSSVSENGQLVIETEKGSVFFSFAPNGETSFITLEKFMQPKKYTVIGVILGIILGILAFFTFFITLLAFIIFAVVITSQNSKFLTQVSKETVDELNTRVKAA